MSNQKIENELHNLMINKILPEFAQSNCVTKDMASCFEITNILLNAVPEIIKIANDCEKCNNE